MAFANWKNKNQPIVTVTVATVVTLEQKTGFEDDKKLSSVTKVTSVTVTDSENQKKSEPLPQIEPLSKIPVFGGGDSVISANSTNKHKVSTRLELINHGTITARIENNGYITASFEKEDNIRVAIQNKAVGLDLSRCAPLVTCNQCEHLALTSSCSRLGKRVIATALRECGSFHLLKKERPQIEEVKPYTQDELNKLLNQAAKPLYHHLIDCQQCSLEDTRYCVEGFGLGNTFDCLLLCFDDAPNKRYELMNQVIKARVSGRRAFESLFSDNAPLPRQDAVKAHQWGNTKEYEAFINHWTGCQVCKPNLNRYCDEGQRLEKEANC